MMLVISFTEPDDIFEPDDLMTFCISNSAMKTYVTLQWQLDRINHYEISSSMGSNEWGQTTSIDRNELQQILEESQRLQQQKHCNNKPDEDTRLSKSVYNNDKYRCENLNKNSSILINCHEIVFLYKSSISNFNMSVENKKVENV